MPRQKVRCVLFGAPGSGKGTQARLIAGHFKVPCIGFGDLVRAEIKDKTPLGLLAKPYVEQAMLAPDDLINAILLSRFKHFQPEKGFVIEGFPRTIDQAEYLDKLAKVTIAIHLRVADQLVVDRMLGRLTCKKCQVVYHEKTAPPAKPGTCDACGGKLYKRPDDQEDLIRERLAAYHFMTEPLAGHYRQRGVFLPIKAELSVESVFQDVVKKMAKLGFSG
jgi:adenylate kinase